MITPNGGAIFIPTGAILDLADRAKAAGCFDEVRHCSVRGTGMNGINLGKVLVPRSKHYFWTKAVDIFAIDRVCGQ